MQCLQARVLDYNPAMPTLRAYEPHDFAPLHKLDQACFPAGISYSKTTLRYFLTLPSADCTVAEDGGCIVGFILTEENPPLAHIVTLDVDSKHRRHGVGTLLLETQEANLAARSEEHTSELQSQSNLVCRLLLEKKKKINKIRTTTDQSTD